jgi:hypothetical protein
MPNATGCPDSLLAAPDDPAGYPKYGMWEERRDYWGRHWQVHRWRGRAGNHDCASCAEDGTRKRARDWAQVHGTDGEDPWTDYLTLCRSCHIRYDKSGHRQPHTAAAREKMSEKCLLAYTEGRRVGQNTHQSGKTHCPQNHEYDEANTYVDKRGYRYCIKCMRERTRQWQVDRKAEVAAERRANPELALKAKANSAGKGSRRSGQALENIRLGSQRRRAREQAEREAREA